MAKILGLLPEEVYRPALTYPAFRQVLTQAVKNDSQIQSEIERIL
jgi:hypothetical protein